MHKIISYATSANVGPGFDCIGLCLSVFNTFIFSEFDDAVIINNNADTIKNKENLIVKSFYAAAEILGKKFKGLKINVKSNIPLSRGLGSSAACITAGVAAAYLLSGQTPVKSDLYEISAKIEGHPDNVAPNIFGAGTVSYISEGKYKCMGFKVSDKYKFLALIPDFKLSTQKAREILPDMINREDVVYNLSRVNLLISALQYGNDDLLREALDDKLHQPYRCQLINRYEDVIKICKKCGAIGTYISGAGPTVMAVVNDEITPKIITKKIAEASIPWRSELMKVNNEGLECFKLN